MAALRPGGRWGRALFGALALFGAGAARAADVPPPAPLPDPLGLEQALALADAPHPDLDQARAGLELARAGLAGAEAVSGVRAAAELTPQWVLPSLRVDDEMVNDSRARLVLSKRLVDFGRSAALEDAARAGIAARELAVLDARQTRRIEIMARFFEVLLADLRYAVDNEAMAHAYVSVDRARDRHAVGQLSDVDLLELEQRYQEALIVRTRSQKRQAQARLQLALALNRPDELPGTLRAPALPGNDREPPDHKALLDTVRERNPSLLALRREVEAARAQLAAERARRRPVVSAEGEAAWYERDFASRDDLRATLNLRVPLWQGGEDRAAIDTAAARLHETAARLARREHELRQAVLDLVQEVESLGIERNAARLRSGYRELYLDRSRALYELEVRTDLGDAMTRLTEAQWLAAQAEYRLALAWAKIDALNGALAPAAEDSP